MPFTYNPDKDIPDLSGKIFLITGGTAGVGTETVHQLSKHNPAQIYFTGRNIDSANKLITSLSHTYKNLTFISMDQTSLASVSEATKSFLEKSGNKLDVLICNAGIMAVPPGVSKDGYEIQFAVNHLAHALIIKLCLPALQKTVAEKGDARIVSLTSLGFKSAPSAGGIIFKDLKTDQANLGFVGKFLCYGQSKLANVLYASYLAKRYPNITTTAVHPGLILGTNLADHMNMLNYLIIKLATLRLKRISLAEGAYNTLWAATSSDKKTLGNGKAYEPVGKAIEPTKFSASVALEEELWSWTEKEIALYS